MATQRKITPRSSLPKQRLKPTSPMLVAAGVASQSFHSNNGNGSNSVISPARVFYHKLTRFSPIRNLQPEVLSRQLDQFQAGYLRELALMFDAIERRDDVLQSVIPKRKAAVKRLKWQVLINEDVDQAQQAEAEKHKEVLYYFYNNLRVTNAIDLNVQAGFPTLVDQMLNCLGHKYAAHEIIWRPSPEGLTATLNYVPLWFFENRTGRLRFLKSDFETDGVDLVDGAWMISVGPGLMEPCSVAYMFKGLSLKDWVLYNEKCGMPGIQGKTDAPKGSQQYTDLTEAVATMAADFSCVTGKEDEIEKLDFSADGQLPYPPLVDRMDRALAWIWRGADLSTISAGSGQAGQGASLQGNEEYKLMCDDAAMVSEVLNLQLDQRILEWYFGPGTVPLASVKIVPPPDVDIDKDIKVFNFLDEKGIELGKRQLREHFAVAEPAEDDEIVEKPEPEQEPGFRPRFAANERLSPTDKKLIQSTHEQFAKDTSGVFAELVAQLETIREMPNEETMLLALRRFQQNLPDLLTKINADPKNAQVLQDAITAGWFNGFLGAEVRRT